MVRKVAGMVGAPKEQGRWTFTMEVCRIITIFGRHSFCYYLESLDLGRSNALTRFRRISEV